MEDVSDPMLDYFGSIGGYLGGGLRGTGVLGEKPFTVKLELNEWFRFDKPGTYTLNIKSRRVTDESVGPPTVIPVESNMVSFEILPRDATWEASALETARGIVDAKRPPLGARPGCRLMRFLGTEAAAMEMIRRYGADTDQGCDFEYMVGLFGAANREMVVRAMEAGLRAVDQPVTASYLRTLSTLSVYLQHPEFRPEQTRETKGRLIVGELSRRIRPDRRCAVRLRACLRPLCEMSHHVRGQRSMTAMFAFVMALAGRRREVVQPLDLLGAQLDAVGGGVFLDAGDPLGAGNRRDVVALREQPGQRDLCRCCTCLAGNGLDFVDDAQVALEVLAGEAWVGLAPVVVGELLGRADVAGEEAMPERRVGNESDAQLAQQRQQFGLRVTASTESTQSAAR